MCPYAVLDLHLLESRLREEDYMLIKAKCGLINTQVQVKICRRVPLPYWCMGGAICEASPSKAQSRKMTCLEEMKIVIIDLKWIMHKAKV